MNKIVRGYKVKNLLEKAKESCLLTVDVYNKPKTSFRSGAFIVFMNIAWTSLFHAIFEYNKINYYYRDKKNPRLYEKIDGEKKGWELKKCTKEYFKNKDKKYLPIQKNIEFFIPLRNKIEHRFMPALDNRIFGECQSLLTNFEKILTAEFGKKHSINENLVYSLQFSENLSNESKKTSEFLKIENYITDFKNNLSDDIINDPKYRFQAVLIPIQNKNKADVAIKFINSDDLTEEDKKNINSIIAIKKYGIRPISDAGNFKAKEVAEKVSNELSTHYKCEINFSHSYHHNICVKKYKAKRGKNKKNTNTDFCIYNEPHDAFSYTEKWINHIITKLKFEEELLKLFPKFKKEIYKLFTVQEVISEVEKNLDKNIILSKKQHDEYAIAYRVRPPSNSKKLYKTNEEFCYHVKNTDYLYTRKWVNHLSNKFRTDLLATHNSVNHSLSTT